MRERERERGGTLFTRSQHQWRISGLGDLSVLACQLSSFVACPQLYLTNRRGPCCSMLASSAPAWITSFDGRRSSDNSGLRRPTIGALQSFWHSSGHYLVASKIQVAADYSDSAADFSNYAGNESYHPFEELKYYGKGRDVLLSDAEIARTTVEANSKALLVFPGRAHCEPHRHVSWAEFHYVIDDYGDIFFELFDDESILKDHSSSNPVTVLIGMDFPVNGESRLENDSFLDYMDNDGIINAMLDDDYEEIVDTEITETLIKWGMPETLLHIHPIYFAKFLAKSIINLQDFQDAEPDVLAHCASAIIERFSEDGMQFDSALKALCRKRKGLVVEGANLIGVDSLGMDVRVFFGLEAKTLRISFNARAMTESSAVKKIRRMLFPHYHRKKSRSLNIGVET